MEGFYLKREMYDDEEEESDNDWGYVHFLIINQGSRKRSKEEEDWRVGEQIEA